MRGLKRFLAVALSSFVVASVPAPVRADNLHDQLNQYQQQAQDLNSQLLVQKQQVTSASNQALALQQSVQTLKNSVAAYQRSLNEQQKALDELQAQQQKLEEQRQKDAEALSGFLRGSYENGVAGYIEVVVQASSLADFLDRVEQVRAIYSTYSKLLSDLAVLNQNLLQQKSLVEKKKAELQITLEEKQQTQQSMQQALEKQQALVSQLTAKQKETLKKAQTVQSEIDRVQQLIEQEELEARLAEQDRRNGVDSGSTNTGKFTAPVKVTGGAAAILNYAGQFVGTPYVWGGTTPKPGFDCSGFTQYVFNHFGIALNRTSQSQYLQGMAVSRSDLQPGDLVFFQTYARGATHVGIYAGNDVMIDSSSGGVVYENMANSYWAPRYLGARRVVAK